MERRFRGGDPTTNGTSGTDDVNMKLMFSSVEYKGVFRGVGMSIGAVDPVIFVCCCDWVYEQSHGILFRRPPEEKLYSRIWVWMLGRRLTFTQ